MPERRSSSFVVPLAFLWAASLLAYAVVRAFLASAYGLPLWGPGSIALVAVLLVASWALVEEPQLAPGARGPLLKLWLGLAALVAGEALIYPLADAKYRLAPLGLGLLGGGALLLWPTRTAKVHPLKAAGAFLVLTLAGLGIWAWINPDSSYMDLVAGPLAGRVLPIAAWILLGLGLLSLCLLAHQSAVPTALGGSTLPWRRERWLLVAALALAALVRLPQMGSLPDGVWFDEVNLARATEDRVLKTGQAPLYVGEEVENPGAYLWVGAAVFKVFGTGVLRYRYLAAFFGLLALFPFWGLARIWLGGRWALVATTLFAVMRWTLIPQRIGFMSGFALFWMLATFWAFWFALGALAAKPSQASPPAWRWVATGALAACNLYTYTPARFVPLILAVFLGLELCWRRDWRGLLRPLGLMATGFAVLAAPMLLYIATHWQAYALRASQVSIFSDAARSGTPLSRELWVSWSRHLLMFNLRGDFNARHNLHLYPHVDLLTGAALSLGLPWALGRFFKDARSRFLTLWLGFMLCAGIFTLASEAPQGHRTILAAPALALAIAWALRDLLGPAGKLFQGGWPKTALAVGLAVLLSVAAFNANEVFGLWSQDSETWRSFSPFATAAARRAAATDSAVEVRLSGLAHEYQFHGYEMGQFVQYFLRPGRKAQPLEMNCLLANGDNSSAVLLLWAESDKEFTEAFAWEFPGIAVEQPGNPHVVAGEPYTLYLAAEVPLARIPYEKGLRRPFLIARGGTP